MSQSDRFDHLSHPPATALGPDVDDDELEPTSDTSDAEAVEKILDPGEDPAT